MDTQPLRIALIGCGAIAETAHLPAAARVPSVRITVLADKNRRRAEALARQVGSARVVEEYTGALGEFDAAVVALPNFLHATVSCDLLRRGIHVLVEKPMATTRADCESMIRAAEQGRAVLAVGFMRRFLRSACFVKELLDGGMLGPIESFDLRDGFVFSWPLTSDQLFRKEVSGGGVLMDFGAHGLDTLLWWLGEVAAVEYFDDDFGGVEADCELHLTMQNGARGFVEFSRTRNLRRTAILRGERATVEVALHSNHVSLRPRSTALEAAAEVRSAALGTANSAHQGLVDLMAEQLADWSQAIRAGGPPRVPGREGLRATALIERCYRQRKPLRLPWVQREQDAGGGHG